MALPERHARYQFAGGIERKMGEQSVPTTRLLALENAVFTKAVSLTKRDGYESLGTAVLGSATAYSLTRGLGARGDEVVLFTEGSSLSYVEAASSWSTIPDGVMSIRQTDRALIKTVSNQTACDYAVSNGIALVCWEDSRGGVYYAVTEAGGGRVTIPPTQAAATASRPRAVRSGDMLVLLWANTGGQLFSLTVDPLRPHVATTAQQVIDDLVVALPNFDAVYSDGTSGAEAAGLTWSSKTGVRVAWLTPGGLIGTSGTGWAPPLTLASGAVSAGPVIDAYANGKEWVLAWAQLSDVYGQTVSSDPHGVPAIATLFAPLSSVAAGAKRGTVEAVDPAGKWLGDTFGQDPRTQLKEIPFSLIADVRQALGAHIGELRQTGGKDLGSFKLLYGALSRDLENSANRGAGAAYAALNHANATAKKEFAVGELDEIFRGTMGKALEGQEFTSSNFAQALNKIRKERIDNELFEQGLGKKTLDSIEARLDEFRRLKINPPPKGVNVGSALVATRMGVGGGVGSFFGPVGTATGVLAAAIGPPAISAIMRSDTGSKALKDILQRRGSVSPEHFRAVIALSLANPDGKRDIRSEVSSVLKSADMSIEEKMQAIMSGEAKLTEIQGANDLLKQ